MAMGTSVTRDPAAPAPRPVAGARSVAGGALARVASTAALATTLPPDERWTVGVTTVMLSVLAVSGVLLCAGAVAAGTGRRDRPGLRLVLLVVSALSAWAVPFVLLVNAAIVHLVVTEPGEFCHDVPCREGRGLIAVFVVSALASITDALLSTAGAVRMCGRLPGRALRRAGWTVLAGGALVTAAAIAFYAAHW